MCFSFIRGRWAVLGVVVFMGLALAGCCSTIPASTRGSPTGPKAESEKPEAALAVPSDKLSADNPVVGLPKSEDLDRRKELAALLIGIETHNSAMAG